MVVQLLCHNALDGHELPKYHRRIPAGGQGQSVPFSSTAMTGGIYIHTY